MFIFTNQRRQPIGVRLNVRVQEDENIAGAQTGARHTRYNQSGSLGQPHDANHRQVFGHIQIEFGLQEGPVAKVVDQNDLLDQVFGRTIEHAVAGAQQGAPVLVVKRHDNAHRWQIAQVLEFGTAIKEKGMQYIVFE